MEGSPANRTVGFFNILVNRWVKYNTLVCVGLDSEYYRIPQIVKDRSKNPEDCIFRFNCQIIDATAEFVCAFKPNIAFYELMGLEGLRALIRTIEYIHNNYPDIPVILDAKRGDISNTNKGYVNAAFNIFKADAITIHPYLGKEAVQLFLDQSDKGIFILCKTSNPGAGELQDLKVINKDTTLPLYQFLALQVATLWNERGNCGLVLGATYPNELGEVRDLVGDIPFLVPGVGAQEGDLEMTLKYGLDSRNCGVIINSARKIIFASERFDFAQAASNEAKKLRDEINLYRFQEA